MLSCFGGVTSGLASALCTFFMFLMVICMVSYLTGLNAFGGRKTTYAATGFLTEGLLSDHAKMASYDPS